MDSVIDMTKVKNAKGTDRYPRPAGYDSWLDYWEKQTGRRAIRCSATDCHLYGRSNLVGAHVKKVYGGDNHCYIVPLCRPCNTRTDEFYVDEELVPVPSNL